MIGSLRLVGIVVGFALATALRIQHLDPLADIWFTEASTSERYRSPGTDVLRLATLGHHLAAADFAWLQAVQTVGAHPDIARVNWDAVEDLALTATDLDTRFLTAYDAAATLLAVYGQRIETADALLMKGRTHLPDEYRFPMLLGYISFFIRGDAAKGAQWFIEASTKPYAPPYAGSLGARLLAIAGNTDSAIALLQDLLPKLDGAAKEIGEWRLKALQSEENLVRYDEACKAHYARTGVRPKDGAELYEAGAVSTPPFDVFGKGITFADGCVARTEEIQRRAWEIHRPE